MTDIKEYNVKTFDDNKHVDEYGNEFWYARELMPLLEYSKWQKFKGVINKAIMVCKQSYCIVTNHFTTTGKMIDIAKGAKRRIIDYKLSRYACYLIVQNCDPRKKIIALAQTYFAVQTRKQELLEEDLPLPDRSLKELEKQKRKLISDE